MPRGCVYALEILYCLLTAMLIVWMASRGRGRRGRPRGTGQAPPTFDQSLVFDQQAFVEAVGIAAATIAQASIASSQGGPSNLQRFRAHHPPTFTGGGDPIVADH